MNKKLLIVGIVAAAGVGVYILYKRSKTSPALSTPGKTPAPGSNDGFGLANTIISSLTDAFKTASTLAKPSASNNLNGTPTYTTEHGTEVVGLSEYGGGGANDQGPV